MIGGRPCPDCLVGPCPIVRDARKLWDAAEEAKHADKLLRDVVGELKLFEEPCSCRCHDKLGGSKL